MACQRCGGGSVPASNRPSSKSDCGCAETPVTSRCTTAFAGGLLRPRFFDGMVLTARDLSDTQDYWRKKRQLTNRALGTGVVWGLRTEWDGKSGAFKLGPGYALDCCGNDVVVEGCEVIPADAVISRSDAVVGKLLTKQSAHYTDGGTKAPARAHLVLKYAEVTAEQRAAGDARCSNGEARTEISRIRESGALCLAPIAAAPRGPMDTLADGLAALGDPAQVEEVFVPQEPSLYLVIRAGDDERVIAASPASDGDWDFPATLFAAGADTTGIEIELRAAPGWLLERGQVQGKDGTNVAVADAPWRLALAWGVPVDKAFEAAFSVTELRLVEATTSRARVLQKPFQIGVTGTAAASVIGEVKASSFGFSSGRAGTKVACLAPLAETTFSPKGLLAGALYAVLASVETGEAQGGGALVATWAATLAAEMLGGNATTERRDEILALLDALLDAWCWGLVYPGPKCETAHHGVVLGTVTLSSSGTVTAFDPWEGRRHVLLGPQVTHWLGQFGVAPPDVLVSRVARTICCAASRTAPSLAAYPNLRFFEKSWHPFGDGAIAVSGDAAILIGDEGVVGPYLSATGAEIVRADEISEAAFVAALVRAASSVGAPPDHGRWVRRSCGALHLVTPATGADLQQQKDWKERLGKAVALVSETKGLGAMEVAPYLELVEALSWHAPSGTDGLTIAGLLREDPEDYAAGAGLEPHDAELRFEKAYKNLDKIAGVVLGVRTPAAPLYRSALASFQAPLEKKLDPSIGKRGVEHAIATVMRA